MNTVTTMQPRRVRAGTAPPPIHDPGWDQAVRALMLTASEAGYDDGLRAGYVQGTRAGYLIGASWSIVATGVGVLLCRWVGWL